MGGQVFIVVGIIFVILWLIMIFVGIATIPEFMSIAQRKGYRLDGRDCASSGLLWAVGIFCTPVLLALYIIALPDLKTQSVLSTQVKSEPARIEDQLPEI